MPIWIFIVIAAWPVIGLVVLALVNRSLEKRGAALPRAELPSEVLLRMYLWPLVWLRVRRSLPGKNPSDS